MKSKDFVNIKTSILFIRVNVKILFRFSFKFVDEM